MKKLVFFPSDPIEAYIEKGRTYKFLQEYYNPGDYFDEVYCLSPWGNDKETFIEGIHYIKANPCDFKKIIKKIKPDVIRGYGGYCCADWVSINKVKGIPTVVSVHDTNPDLIHDSLKYADIIICMAQAVKDAVVELVPNVSKDNIYIMPNRIDISKFKKLSNDAFFSELDSKYGNCKHILHVGRKTEQKNLDTVIKALKHINYDCKCIFIGQGDYSRYEELARRENVIDKCVFIPRIEYEELPLWYSWCDCMCTPSRWEGFGYVFIEAAACETIVITSNIGPMNEYLKDGETALLVDDYENPVEIANYINQALTNDENVQRIRKNARSVGMKFSKESVDQQEIEIYQKALELTKTKKGDFFERVHLVLQNLL